MPARPTWPVISASATQSNATTPFYGQIARFGSSRAVGSAVTLNDTGNIELSGLLKVLGQRGISSLLVEGGSQVITSFLRLGLADRLVAIVAPKVLGKGIEAVSDLNINEVGKAIPLSFQRIYRSGVDLVIEARVNR